MEGIFVNGCCILKCWHSGLLDVPFFGFQFDLKAAFNLENGSNCMCSCSCVTLHGVSRVFRDYMYASGFQMSSVAWQYVSEETM